MKQGSEMFSDAGQGAGVHLGDPGSGWCVRQNLDMDKGTQMTLSAFITLFYRKWRKF